MSLRRFLNVAYAILVEEYQRMGVDLLTALDRVSEWGEGVAESVPATPRPIASRHNEASMAALQGMLAGVPNAPTKKPRRA